MPEITWTHPFVYQLLKIIPTNTNTLVDVGCGRGIIGALMRSWEVQIMDRAVHVIFGGDNKRTKPIHIGNNVWIGTKATIMKRVTIGDRSEVAAGTILTKDVPLNSLVAGVPCKVIKGNIKWEG